MMWASCQGFRGITSKIPATPDLVFLEMFKAAQFVDVSLDNWLRRLPPEVVAAHLNLGPDLIARISADNDLVIPR